MDNLGDNVIPVDIEFKVNTDKSAKNIREALKQFEQNVKGSVDISVSQKTRTEINALKTTLRSINTYKFGALKQEIESVGKSITKMGSDTVVAVDKQISALDRLMSKLAEVRNVQSKMQNVNGSQGSYASQANPFAPKINVTGGQQSISNFNKAMDSLSKSASADLLSAAKSIEGVGRGLNNALGVFDRQLKAIKVKTSGRSAADIEKTLVHELTHAAVDMLPQLNKDKLMAQVKADLAKKDNGDLRALKAEIEKRYVGKVKNEAEILEEVFVHAVEKAYGSLGTGQNAKMASTVQRFMDRFFGSQAKAIQDAQSRFMFSLDPSKETAGQARARLQGGSASSEGGEKGPRLPKPERIKKVTEAYNELGVALAGLNFDAFVTKLDAMVGHLKTQRDSVKGIVTDIRKTIDDAAKQGRPVAMSGGGGGKSATSILEPGNEELNKARAQLASNYAKNNPSAVVTQIQRELNQNGELIRTFAVKMGGFFYTLKENAMTGEKEVSAMNKKLTEAAKGLTVNDTGARHLDQYLDRIAKDASAKIVKTVEGVNGTVRLIERQIIDAQGQLQKVYDVHTINPQGKASVKTFDNLNQSTRDRAANAIMSVDPSARDATLAKAASAEEFRMMKEATDRAAKSVRDLNEEVRKGNISYTDAQAKIDMEIKKLRELGDASGMAQAKIRELTQAQRDLGQAQRVNDRATRAGLFLNDLQALGDKSGIKKINKQEIGGIARDRDTNQLVRTNTDVLKVGNSYIQVTKIMNESGQVIDVTTKALKNHAEALRAVSNLTGKTQRSMLDLIQTAGRVIVSYGLITQSVGLFKSAIESSIVGAAKFESALYDIRKIMKLETGLVDAKGDPLEKSFAQQEKSLERLAEKAKSLSVTFGFGREELLEVERDFIALYQNEADAINASVSAAKLSIATNIKLGETSKYIVAVATQFKLTSKGVDEFVDKINEVTNIDPTVKADLLVQNLTRVGPIAEGAGISIDKTLALTTAGMKAFGSATAEIGNALKAFFSDLQDDNKKKIVIDYLGVKSLKGISVDETVGLIIKKKAELDSKVKEALAKGDKKTAGEIKEKSAKFFSDLGGKTQGARYLTLLGNSEEYSKLLGEDGKIKNFKGSAEREASIQMNSLKNIFQTTLQSLTLLGENMGASLIPTLKNILIEARTIFVDLNDRRAQFQDGFLKLAAILQPVGSLIKGVFEGFATPFMSAYNAIKSLAQAFTGADDSVAGIRDRVKELSAAMEKLGKIGGFVLGAMATSAIAKNVSDRVGGLFGGNAKISEGAEFSASVKTAGTTFMGEVTRAGQMFMAEITTAGRVQAGSSALSGMVGTGIAGTTAAGSVSALSTVAKTGEEAANVSRLAAARAAVASFVANTAAKISGLAGWFKELGASLAAAQKGTGALAAAGRVVAPILGGLGNVTKLLSVPALALSRVLGVAGVTGVATGLATKVFPNIIGKFGSAGLAALKFLGPLGAVITLMQTAFNINSEISAHENYGDVTFRANKAQLDAEQALAKNAKEIARNQQVIKANSARTDLNEDQKAELKQFEKDTTSMAMQQKEIQLNLKQMLQAKDAADEYIRDPNGTNYGPMMAALKAAGLDKTWSGKDGLPALSKILDERISELTNKIGNSLAISDNAKAVRSQFEAYTGNKPTKSDGVSPIFGEEEDKNKLSKFNGYLDKLLNSAKRRVDIIKDARQANEITTGEEIKGLQFVLKLNEQKLLAAQQEISLKLKGNLEEGERESLMAKQLQIAELLRDNARSVLEAQKKQYQELVQIEESRLQIAASFNELEGDSTKKALGAFSIKKQELNIELAKLNAFSYAYEKSKEAARVKTGDAETSAKTINLEAQAVEIQQQKAAIAQKIVALGMEYKNVLEQQYKTIGQISATFGTILGTGAGQAATSAINSSIEALKTQQMIEVGILSGQDAKIEKLRTQLGYYKDIAAYLTAIENQEIEAKTFSLSSSQQNFAKSLIERDRLAYSKKFTNDSLFQVSTQLQRNGFQGENPAESIGIKDVQAQAERVRSAISAAKESGDLPDFNQLKELEGALDEKGNDAKGLSSLADNLSKYAKGLQASTPEIQKEIEQFNLLNEAFSLNAEKRAQSLQLTQKEFELKLAQRALDAEIAKARVDELNTLEIYLDMQDKLDEHLGRTNIFKQSQRDEIRKAAKLDSKRNELAQTNAEIDLERSKPIANQNLQKISDLFNKKNQLRIEIEGIYNTVNPLRKALIDISKEFSDSFREGFAAALAKTLAGPDIQKLEELTIKVRELREKGQDYNKQISDIDTQSAVSIYGEPEFVRKRREIIERSQQRSKLIRERSENEQALAAAEKEKSEQSNPLLRFAKNYKEASGKKEQEANEKLFNFLGTAGTDFLKDPAGALKNFGKTPDQLLQEAGLNTSNYIQEAGAAFKQQIIEAAQEDAKRRSEILDPLQKDILESQRGLNEKNQSALSDARSREDSITQAFSDGVSKFGEHVSKFGDKIDAMGGNLSELLKGMKSDAGSESSIAGAGASANYTGPPTPQAPEAFTPPAPSAPKPPGPLMGPPVPPGFNTRVNQRAAAPYRAAANSGLAADIGARGPGGIPLGRRGPVALSQAPQLSDDNAGRRAIAMDMRKTGYEWDPSKTYVENLQANGSQRDKMKSNGTYQNQQYFPNMSAEENERLRRYFMHGAPGMESSPNFDTEMIPEMQMMGEDSSANFDTGAKAQMKMMGGGGGGRGRAAARPPLMTMAAMDRPRQQARPPAPPRAVPFSAAIRHQPYIDLRLSAPAQQDALFFQRKFGGTMSSGYRDPERNRRAGGVPNSRHLSANASDHVGVGPERSREIKAAMAKRGAWADYHNFGTGWHWHIDRKGAGRPGDPNMKHTDTEVLARQQSQQEPHQQAQRRYGGGRGMIPNDMPGSVRDYPQPRQQGRPARATQGYRGGGRAPQYHPQGQGSARGEMYRYQPESQGGQPYMDGQESGPYGQQEFQIANSMTPGAGVQAGFRSPIYSDFDPNYGGPPMIGPSDAPRRPFEALTAEDVATWSPRYDNVKSNVVSDPTLNEGKVDDDDILAAIARTVDLRKAEGTPTFYAGLDKNEVMQKVKDDFVGVGDTVETLSDKIHRSTLFRAPGKDALNAVPVLRGPNGAAIGPNPNPQQFGFGVSDEATRRIAGEITGEYGVSDHLIPNYEEAASVERLIQPQGTEADIKNAMYNWHADVKKKQTGIGSVGFDALLPVLGGLTSFAAGDTASGIKQIGSYGGQKLAEAGTSGLLSALNPKANADFITKMATDPTIGIQSQIGGLVGSMGAGGLRAASGQKEENRTQADRAGASAGSSIGGTVGGVLGTAIGGPLGTAIGAALGGLAGDFIGGSIGDALGGGKERTDRENEKKRLAEEEKERKKFIKEQLDALKEQSKYTNAMADYQKQAAENAKINARYIQATGQSYRSAGELLQQDNSFVSASSLLGGRFVDIPGLNKQAAAGDAYAKINTGSFDSGIKPPQSQTANIVLSDGTPVSADGGAVKIPAQLVSTGDVEGIKPITVPATPLLTNQVEHPDIKVNVSPIAKAGGIASGASGFQDRGFNQEELLRDIHTKKGIIS